jgi:Uma2 family endonuclease
MRDQSRPKDKNQRVRGQPTAQVQEIEKETPPLKHGQRLSREEFERRYEAIPHIKKAELIQGVVYMPSPVRAIHGKPHAHMMTWLGVYCAATPNVELMDNTTVRLEGDNELQPDALLRIDEAVGGNSRISEDDYVEGAPELIVEIAATSADYDLHEKFEVYQRSGVKEYIVWRTQEEELDWFRLVEGQYARLTPDAEGIIESQIFPGLRLNAAALLRGDLAMALSELQRGLQTAEHAAFAKQLSA